MSQITVIAKLTAKPGLEQRVMEELEHMVSETEKEIGCINYDLHRQIDDPSVFLFHENWISKEALDKHMQTPHFKHLSSIKNEILVEDASIALFELVKGSRVGSLN